jgi:hypothetical protein
MTPALIKRLVKPLIDKAVFASAGYEELKNALIASSSELIDFNKPIDSELDERIRQIAEFVRPIGVKGATEVRVGREHDGGYVMHDFASSEFDGALSIGVGPDVSWDQDVVAKGLKVDLFDPTIRRMPDKVPGARFHRVGIGPIDSVNSNYVSLPKLRQIAGLGSATNIILKIDVEGAEWSSLKNLPEDELPRYAQIVIEMHNLGRIEETSLFTSILETLNALSENHLVVHLHGNNYAPLNKYGNYWFPDAIEVTYVRKNSEQVIEAKSKVSSLLDSANCPTMLDFSLDGILSL